MQRGIAALGFRAIPLVACALFALSPAGARDVPDNITVELKVSSSPDRIQVFARVPLAGLKDVEFPADNTGNLDPQQIHSMAHGLARWWIADAIEIRSAQGRDGPPRAASAYVSGPDGSVAAPLNWRTAMLSTSLEYPKLPQNDHISIRTRFAGFGLRTETRIRVCEPGGKTAELRYENDPGPVWLNPTFAETMKDFALRGAYRLFGRIEIWLFLACFLIPLNGYRASLKPLIFFVSFSAMGFALLAVRATGAEAAIWAGAAQALAILYLALGNIFWYGAQKRRPPEAAVFGLIFGAAFAFALQPLLQFSGTHRPAAAVAFGIGMEAAQLSIAAAFFLVCRLLRQGRADLRRETIVLSALAGHTAWRWAWDRLSDTSVFISASSWRPAGIFILLVGCAALLWLIALRLRVRFSSVATALSGVLAALFLFSATASAHDVPEDVRIAVLARPSGDRFQMLARVPVEALIDLEFPTLPGTGYLDLPRVAPLLPDAAILWISNLTTLYENGRSLPKAGVVSARISLESDRSFASFDRALAHVTGPPLPSDTLVVWNQAMLDVLFEAPIRSQNSGFAIDPRFGRLGVSVTTDLQFLTPAGAVRSFEYEGNPGVIRLDPAWHQTAAKFAGAGFLAAWRSAPELLLLICIVVLFRRTSDRLFCAAFFGLAHAASLAAVAADGSPRPVWLAPLIALLSAVCIVYLTFEIILETRSLRPPIILASGFGAVLGCGFALALDPQMQFAGAHRIVSVLSFNGGTAAAQATALALFIPGVEILFRFTDRRKVSIILAALIADRGWGWVTDRAGELRRFPFHWPAFNVLLAAAMLRWLGIVLAIAGFVWIFAGIAEKLRNRRTETTPPPDNQPVWSGGNRF